ncbi:MAG: hypothetical protein JXA82_19125 [Sedimentisphaerales bacterium]|nr:hypothetical protein [Sedimentisphaerales bacterium]
MLADKASSPYYVKHVDPSRIAMEFYLTNQANQLSRRTNWFYTPEVMDWDSVSGLLKLERINGLIPLSIYINNTHQDLELLWKVGRALGTIHLQMKPSSKIKSIAPKPWCGRPEDQVIVHGDFNTTNIGCRSTDKRIIILDWSNGPALPFQCCIASRYLDLAHFVRSLLLQQSCMIKAMQRYPDRMNVFLQGYCDQTGIVVDFTKLFTFLVLLNHAIMKKQWRQRKIISFIQSCLVQPLFAVSRINKKWHKKLFCVDPKQMHYSYIHSRNEKNRRITT